MEKWPNFFIVGAPKAGTTSLYEYLRKIPGVYMSAIKEPHFFSSKKILLHEEVKISRADTSNHRCTDRYEPKGNKAFSDYDGSGISGSSYNLNN